MKGPQRAMCTVFSFPFLENICPHRVRSRHSQLRASLLLLLATAALGTLGGQMQPCLFGNERRANICTSFLPKKGEAFQTARQANPRNEPWCWSHGPLSDNEIRPQKSVSDICQLVIGNRGPQTALLTINRRSMLVWQKLIFIKCECCLWLYIVI